MEIQTVLVVAEPVAGRRADALASIAATNMAGPVTRAPRIFAAWP